MHIRVRTNRLHICLIKQILTWQMKNRNVNSFEKIETDPLFSWYRATLGGTDIYLPSFNNVARVIAIVSYNIPH